MSKLFTSESVTEGHPDKIADQISDAVVDAVMVKDPRGRVACETLVTNGMCVVAGEMTTSCYVDIPAIARGVIRDIGYTDPAYGFHWETCGISVAIHEQSSDIARGIIRTKQSRDVATMGAGDQGIVFGYACRETPELMPLPIVLSHSLCERLAYVRKRGIIKGLRPDGKSQVTVEYDNGKPVRVHTVLLAVQHDPEWKQKQLRAAVEKLVIRPVLFDPRLRVRGLAWQKETQRRWKDLRIIVNGTGRFVIGGPQGDTGLTGRKIIVDTYGGMARHGGGCFSGKDPTKVDRSGSYAARWVAKNVVAARLAERCEVQIAYAIGIPEPLSVRVDTFGTGRFSDEAIGRAIIRVFDLRPGMIIQALKLRRPIYRQVAAYGHFGRSELRLPWESTTMARKLRHAMSFDR